MTCMFFTNMYVKVLKFEYRSNFNPFKIEYKIDFMSIKYINPCIYLHLLEITKLVCFFKIVAGKMDPNLASYMSKVNSTTLQEEIKIVGGALTRYTQLSPTQDSFYKKNLTR